MQLCDYSIYYPYRQVVKQIDLCLCISMWSSGVRAPGCAALSGDSDHWVLIICSLRGQCINAYSSGYTWTFTQHTQSIVTKQRRMGPTSGALARRKVPEEIIYPAGKQQIKLCIHHVSYMHKKKKKISPDLSESQSWGVGGMKLVAK